MSFLTEWYHYHAKLQSIDLEEEYNHPSLERDHAVHVFSSLIDEAIGM
jgi:hypothetical protein